MLKPTVLILLSCLILTRSFSQDSLYKHQVDSILISRSKTSVKIIKVKSDNFRVRYFFKKDTKELALIEVSEQNGKIISIYNYHYIDGEFKMLSKYKNYPLADKMREKAFYYLKNGELIYKTENSAQIDNISFHLERAQQLKQTAPFY